MTDEHPGCVSRREFELWCAYHAREHHIHAEAHDREHEFMLASLSKSVGDLSYKRLDFHPQFELPLDTPPYFDVIPAVDIRETSSTAPSLASLRVSTGSRTRARLMR